jgi:hypothetical protein
MKREYSKPTIHVENMSMDMPVATSCDRNFGLEFPELNEQGWFVGEQNCGNDYDHFGGEMDQYGDTLCYHSHTRTVFQS